MSDWCSCDPLRKAEAKAAKYDALMERMGGLSRLIALLEGDCDKCAAIVCCNENSGTCERTRALWLLGVEV